MDNKVIIIGNDHTNTLGVIRSLGENKIMSYVYLISSEKINAVKYSKYIVKCCIFRNEEEALIDIIEKFQNEQDKPILIPTSDTAAFNIDLIYNKISKVCITQNIGEISGTINKLMNKYNQYRIAKENNIKIAESKEFELTDKEIKLELKFPVIIKPLLSIEGKKGDIIIVENEYEFNNAINDLRKDYRRVLVQEYVNFDYECDMSGYSYQNEVAISGYIKKYRIWPPKRGSMTFGEVKKYNNEGLKKIKEMIKNIGYTGLFDIEFFIKGEEVYLNEINFRNSGLTYLYDKSYLCYYYYLSCIKNTFIQAPMIKKEYFVMDEYSEINQILKKNITLKEHFSDKKKVKKFLVSNRYDIMPSIVLLLKKIIRKLGV